jgi:hypothetical protein
MTSMETGRFVYTLWDPTITRTGQKESSRQTRRQDGVFNTLLGPDLPNRQLLRQPSFQRPHHQLFATHRLKP